jgi:hypothetical protein
MKSFDVGGKTPVSRVTLSVVDITLRIKTTYCVASTSHNTCLYQADRAFSSLCQDAEFSCDIFATSPRP